MAKIYILRSILATVIILILVLLSAQFWQSIFSTPTKKVIQFPNKKIDKKTKKAMTWVFVKGDYKSTEAQYFLFGRDEKTNAYSGDTDINQKADLLCIEKNAHIPIPSILSKREITNGGAWRHGWSGRQAIIVPNVIGTSLSSKAKADELCETSGNQFGIKGLRMAEFHDGGKGNEAGWSFWVDGTKGNIIQERKRGLNNRRFWVSINDQPANPWN
jgi:hypothetical protein